MEKLKKLINCKEGNDKGKATEEKIRTVGPWGGSEGEEFDDGTFSGIKEIKIGYDDYCIPSIQVIYGNSTVQSMHGRPADERYLWGVKFAEIKLQYPQEFIIKVRGHYGAGDNQGEPVFYFGRGLTVVRSLTFVSNLRTYGPYGVESGRSFSFATDGSKIVGLMGRSDRFYINAIGFHLSAPVAAPANPFRNGWAKVRSFCLPSQESRREAMTNLLRACYDNKSKVKELQDYAKNLKVKRDHVKQQVQQNGTRIDEDVNDWLQKVDEKITEIEKNVNDWLQKLDKMIIEIGKNLEDQKMGNCFNVLYPNKLGAKHQLGERATKMKLDVDQLLQQANRLEKECKESFEYSGDDIVDMITKAMKDFSVGMNNGMYRLSDKSNRSLVKEIASKRADNVVGGYQNFDSRSRTLERIMGPLRDPDFVVIGIYGQGGVGKSTLAGQVARRAQEEKLFDTVGMISLSRNAKAKNIQAQIAEAMGLKLEEENVMGRAQILTNSLIRQKKSLVILDDLWEPVALWNIPISRHFSYIGKILLISRSKMLLSEYIDDQNIFCVGVLEEKEAKTLLRKVGGIVEQDLAFEYLVDKFAIQTCALSPNLILSIGSYLRGQSCCQWKIAFEKLQDIKFTELALQDMQFPTEMILAYGAEQQSFTFLSFCAAMGNHPLIVDLLKLQVRHSWWSTVKEILNDIHKWISYLKELNLMLDSYSSDRVTVSDEVQDSSLSIIFKSRTRNIFTMRNGRLEKWPNNDELVSCTAIFLHSSVIISQLPKGMHCPNLEIFHLDSNDPFLKIPDNFFIGMRGLAALKLIGIQLSTIPSSIKCLEMLQSLCLEQCMIYDNLSFIGEFKKLRVLSLSGSEFESFSIELGKLGNLTLFDINNCSKLKVIPPNVLSSLHSLEHFYSRNNSIQWQVEGLKNQSQNASLTELSHLHKLSTLLIDLPDVAVLPTNAFFHKLEMYEVVIGDSNKYSPETFKMSNEDELSKSLALLQLKEGTESKRRIETLFEGVENLLLGELKGFRNVFYDMKLENFPCLKHLSIVNNMDTQYIINSENLVKAFSELKSLCLIKLPNMEKIICCNQLADASFRNLKTMKVQNCGRVKNLFPFSMARLFTNLEILEISECQSLKEIVALEREENNSKEVANPNTESSALSSVDNHQTFHFQNLMKLNIQNCGSVRYLLSFSMAASLTNLKSLCVSGCKMMEQIILMPQKINMDEAKVSIFPKLEEFHLVCMESLTTIWHSQVANLNSENLELSSVNNHRTGSDQPSPSYHFQNTIKSNVEAILTNLNSLSIIECKLMEEIFIPQQINMDDAKIGSDQLSPGFHFQNLMKLNVKDCGSLRYLLSFSMAAILTNLNSLSIIGCNLMEDIFIPQEINMDDAKVNIFPKLEEFHLIGMERMTSIWHRKCGPHSYNVLDSVVIEECPKLVTIFPNHMVGRISLLVRLKVVNCQSVEEIFDIKDISQLNVAEKETCLRFVHIEALSKLKCIWNRDPNGILNFKYLKKVWVSKCPNLKNLIPVSIANGLEYSQSLAVRDCNSIEEIVFKE